VPLLESLANTTTQFRIEAAELRHSDRRQRDYKTHHDGDDKGSDEQPAMESLSKANELAQFRQIGSSSLRSLELESRRLTGRPHPIRQPCRESCGLLGDPIIERCQVHRGLFDFESCVVEARCGRLDLCGCSLHARLQSLPFTD